MRKEPELEGTRRLMGALVRQPPKQHDEMKIGKAGEEPVSAEKKRGGASAKPKTARRSASGS